MLGDTPEPLPLPCKSPTAVVGGALVGYFSLEEGGIPLRPPISPCPGEMMLQGPESHADPSCGGQRNSRHLQLHQNPSGPRIKAITSVN